MFRRSSLLVVVVAALTGCNVDPAGCPCNRASSSGNNGDGSTASGAMVNLQVTAYEGAQAFTKIIAELEARGVKATILTKPDFVTENCEQIRALHDAGFEIMAYARPDPQDGQNVALTALSAAEQQQHIAEVKTAIEACLNTPVKGFGCASCAQNDDTFAVVDAQGLKFNVGFVAHTGQCLPDHENDTFPYQAPSHDFWAVPMHAMSYDGEWVPFTDTAFAERVSATEWGQLLKDQLDSHHEQGRPLLIGLEPSVTGDDDAIFDAFVDFLDHAAEQDTRFVTVEELVEWTEVQVNPDCGCLG